MNIHESTKLPPPEQSAREFDFLIGTWNIVQHVLQNDGNWLEFTACSVFNIDLDGYAVIEHWEGVTLLPWEGMTEPESRKALSIRAFEPQTKLWNIYWIDSRNRQFIPTSTGSFKDGCGGEFFSFLDPNNPQVRGRITFSNIKADSVDWDFAVSKGDDWKKIWTMKLIRA